jgi:hypothetical protein
MGGAGDPGPLIGRGRAADVCALGADRVLRRYRTPHSCAAEAGLMKYLRLAPKAGPPPVRTAQPGDET